MCTGFLLDSVDPHAMFNVFLLLNILALSLSYPPLSQENAVIADSSATYLVFIPGNSSFLQVTPQAPLLYSYLQLRNVFVFFVAFVTSFKIYCSVHLIAVKCSNFSALKPDRKL